MAGKFARSWGLMKASAAVLRSDKALLAFPLLSGLCSLVVAASFLVPVALAAIASDGGRFDAHRWSPVTWLVMFAFYLVQYFVIVFFNTALAGCALRHLRGEPTRLSDGLALARSRWASILGYALIAATVGLILRALQERLGLLGRLVVGLLGLAWTVATFLVVPVLASQDVGPVDAVKRSVELLKRTWGENLIGNVGLGAASGLITLLAMLLGALLIGGAVALHSLPALVTAVVVVVVALVLLSLVQASLQGIYAAALYRYAEGGEAGAGFEPALLQGAFRAKK
ncbi:DUF6159 family protein [Frateuria terrea]|uniref:Membrane domain of glycerophosphoryl diester phosphodiesterase n=1 Tax=Frateuria terrea TaxID=529704 RepID=A0A1H6WWN4_9GAMM|nr:DUF6159 family protein [Frateuria terrea]SEJ20286.1 hypothetical protein SAMN04487997_2706 [Frateuria terrea]SFP57709.1 hypothetical protein SAMN02927913_2683 [Frateuria terrea]